MEKYKYKRKKKAPSSSILQCYWGEIFWLNSTVAYLDHLRLGTNLFLEAPKNKKKIWNSFPTLIFHLLFSPPKSHLFLYLFDSPQHQIKGREKRDDNIHLFLSYTFSLLLDIWYIIFFIIAIISVSILLNKTIEFAGFNELTVRF